MNDKPTETRPAWENQLGAILARRDSTSANPAQWRKVRSELRRGNSPHTEHYAYPHVLPYVSESSSQKEKTVLLRLFALVAEFSDIPQWRKTEGEGGFRSFGKWAYSVSQALAKKRNEAFTLDPNSPDVIAQRLQQIHSLDAEQAILMVSRMMKIADGLPGPIPAIDYYGLFRTFLRWGDGFTSQSQHVRRSILRDYYSAFEPVSAENKNT